MSSFMESFKPIFVVVVIALCLLGVNSDTRRPPVHETRDAIHQVGYNFPSWPSPEHTDSSLAQSAQPLAAQDNEEISTLDRFYRVSSNGTVEFKIVLSDGQINYQKIDSKIVGGKTVQTYDGYYSVRLPDGVYRTTYYTADEMGYRLLGYVTDTVPPVEWRKYEKKLVLSRSDFSSANDVNQRILESKVKDLDYNHLVVEKLSQDF